MGGRGDNVSLGLLEENERKGRGLPRFGFAREGVVHCCWLLRGRRKSRGGERCVRAVRVCGSMGGWTTAGCHWLRDKKLEKENWLQENRVGKAYFVPILSSPLPTF
jgi:hypothetical protein